MYWQLFKLSADLGDSTQLCRASYCCWCFGAYFVSSDSGFQIGIAGKIALCRSTAGPICGRRAARSSSFSWCLACLSAVSYQRLRANGRVRLVWYFLACSLRIVWSFVGSPRPGKSLRACGHQIAQTARSSQRQPRPCHWQHALASYPILIIFKLLVRHNKA